MARRKVTKYIVVHATNTKPNEDISLCDVDEWHRKKGKLKVGYHFFIKRDGTIQSGRSPNEIGSHVCENDSESIAVCISGGKNTRGIHAPDYCKEQIESLFVLLKTLKFMYPDAEVVGHRDLEKTQCPSFDVRKWWELNEDNFGLLKFKYKDL